jgi:thiol-disulfide isomerase/thioredoxin
MMRNANAMIARLVVLTSVIAAGAGRAVDETLPILRVGSEVYSNVTITSVTATDIYFSHSGGLGNAKLRTLDPALQKQFHFNPQKGAAKEKEQTQANILYTTAAREAKAAPRPLETANDAQAGEQPSHRIAAKSFLNQPAPRITVQQWLTDPPEINGKFVLIDFWATWCAPCRRSIPHLNALSHRFSDKLIIMGISNETEDAVRKMTSPTIDYSVGVDPESLSAMAAGVQAIPHALLVDPHGIVRFEGHPEYLDEEKLGNLLAKYSP